MNCRVSSQTDRLSRLDHLSTLSGAFYGDALDRIQLEAQMARYWKPAWVKRECEAGRGAWFDYRHAHPVLRSHYFLHEYTLAYRRGIQRFYDAHANVTGIYPMKRRNLYTMPAMAISQAISLMQTVDEARLPYDTFFDGAIEHMMQKREFARVWTRQKGLAGCKLPPMRVLKDAQCIIAATELFERRNRTRLRLASHPTYFAECWAGTPDQQDYVRYLFVEMRKRAGSIRHTLAALVYDRGVLREHEVARQFGLEMVREIRVIRDC